jgi:hypothetical protein
MSYRGIVIRDLNDGSGLLEVNGKQYSFDLEGLWQSAVAPEIGMPVDVTFNSDGAPESVRCAETPHPARRTVSPKHT